VASQTEVMKSLTDETLLRGLSPRSNYTDRATAVLAKLVPTFVDRGVSRGQRNVLPRPYSWLSRPEQLLFLPSSSSIVFTDEALKEKLRLCN
jgi:hypothetical protein